MTPPKPLAYCAPVDGVWVERARALGARVFTDDVVVLSHRRDRMSVNGACDLIDAVTRGRKVAAPRGRLVNPYLPSLRREVEALGGVVVALEALDAPREERPPARRGGPPRSPLIYGYRVRGGQVEPHPERAEVVRRVFDAYLGGATLRAIAESLNAERIPTAKGRRWRAEQVRWMLMNPAYGGDAMGGGTVPALVSVGDWFEVQRERQSRKPPRAGGIPESRHPSVSPRTYSRRIREGWDPHAAAMDPVRPKRRKGAQ